MAKKSKAETAAKKSPAMTPAEIKALIDQLDPTAQKTLYSLVVGDLGCAFGGLFRELALISEQIIVSQALQLELRNRKPDDPDADEILALKEKMSWEQLAEHLSEKENRKVTVNNARQRYFRAKKRNERAYHQAIMKSSVFNSQLPGTD